MYSEMAASLPAEGQGPKVAAWTPGSLDGPRPGPCAVQRSLQQPARQRGRTGDHRQQTAITGKIFAHDAYG